MMKSRIIWALIAGASCVVFRTTTVGAQSSDSTPAYDGQALRYESYWGNARIIRGADGPTVGTAGWFRGFDVEKLVAASPSAQADARSYKTNNFRGSVVGSIGEAYEFYLRGRQYFHQHRRKSLEFARQMFERAIELDPGYALAHAGIADCCSFLYQYYNAAQALLDEADTASRRALDLAPDLAEAHASRGLAVSLSNRFDEAEEEFQTAMRLDPKSFEAAYFYARACVARGKPEEAVKWYERAIAVRPDDFAALALLATTYIGLGRREDATRCSRRAYDAARRHLELNPDNPRALYMGAMSLTNLGESEKAREWNRRALAMEPDDPSVLYNIACAFAAEKQTEEAVAALNKAIDKGFGHWKWIDHDPDLDSLRNEPGFREVVARRPVEEVA